MNILGSGPELESAHGKNQLEMQDVNFKTRTGLSNLVLGVFPTSGWGLSLPLYCINYAQTQIGFKLLVFSLKLRFTLENKCLVLKSSFLDLMF
jgi:hypothetical protein